MNRGVTLAAASNVSALGIGLLYRSAYPPSLTPQSWVGPLLWFAPLTITFVTSCWAAWHLAMATSRFTRRAARLAGVGTLLGLSLAFLNSRLLEFYFDPSWLTVDRIDQRFLQPARVAGSWLFTICWPTAIGLTVITVAKLFELSRRCC